MIKNRENFLRTLGLNSTCSLTNIKLIILCFLYCPLLTSPLILCPELHQIEGVELNCLLAEAGSRSYPYDFKKYHKKSEFLEKGKSCELSPLPTKTLVHFQCAPFYKSDEEGGYIKCNNKGRWRNYKRLLNFKCHLHASGWIDKVIHTHKVVIFGKSFCGYCQETKRLFGSIGAQYFSVDLDLMDPKRAELVKEALFQKTGMKTWPNVFVNEEHLGGFDDTFYAFEDRTIFKLLRNIKKHNVAESI